MTERMVDVAIVGGGMGGMVLGAALAHAGIDYQLYEQAPRFGVIGGHLTIDTAAIDIIGRYGLDAPFHELACCLNTIEVRKFDTGEVVANFPFPDLGSMGVTDPNRHGTREVFGFLRADFVRMVAERLPQDRLNVGHRLVGLTEANGRAVAEFGPSL